MPPKLRGVMEDLDGQLVVFDRVSDALTSDVRRQMAERFAPPRAQAAERLAATVARSRTFASIYCASRWEARGWNP